MPKTVSTPIPPRRKSAALRLLRAREERGLSQVELATELGCSKRQLAAIERGQVRAIGLEALDLLLQRNPGAERRSAAGSRDRGVSSASTLVSAAADIRKAGHQPNGGDGATHRGVYRSLVAKQGIANYLTVAGSNPATPPHRNQSVSSAQRQESACRRASEAYRVSGSTAELGGVVVQPELSIRRAA
jgi:hypothetical protein